MVLWVVYYPKSARKNGFPTNRTVRQYLAREGARCKAKKKRYPLHSAAGLGANNQITPTVTKMKRENCSPIASASGRRSTPSTNGTASTIRREVKHGDLAGARPLVHLSLAQEQRLIDTITTLGARATPAVLLSVIAICRQYLTEPQQQTVHANFNRTQNKSQPEPSPQNYPTALGLHWRLSGP